MPLFESRHSLLHKPAGSVEAPNDRGIRGPAIAVLTGEQARPSEAAQSGSLLTLENRLGRITHAS
jgi:hypothetical protein